jgi:hypothetical protein
LHTFAERLIEPLAAPERAQERAWVVRFQWFIAAVVVLIALGFVGRSLKQQHDLKSDLAPSASWKASSHFEPECACESPEQSCAACPNFFFCTAAEDHPFIVFDLHSIQSLSGVVVDNRRDGYTERAVPLVVQVSADKKHWKTVAKRTEDFTTWRADFETERVRWVKLSVSRHDFLHLSKVRLLP